MHITATVEYQEIEGGFWGLVGDDGQRYEPVDELPEAVRTAGCRVEADVEPADVLSFRQWGRPVRIHRIEQR